MSKIIINPTGFGWKKGFGTHSLFCLSIEQHFIHVNGDLKEHMQVVILVFRRQIYWYWLNLNLILYLNIQFNVIEKKLMQSHEEAFVWFPNRKSEYSELRSQRRNNELSNKKINGWIYSHSLRLLFNMHMIPNTLVLHARRCFFRSSPN